MSAPANTTFRFYHVAQETPAAADDVLARLLEKAVAAGQRILVVCPTEARTTRLDDALWTYADAAFLPHMAVAPDGLQPAETLQRQPVLLVQSAQTEGHAAGRLPIVLAGSESAFSALLQNQPPEKLFYLFHAAPGALETARNHWKQLKAAGHTLEYWQQQDGPKGMGWTRKQ